MMMNSASGYHFSNDFLMKWSSSPACTELEAVVMHWAARLLGLSSTFMNKTGIGGGVIMVHKTLAIESYC
jgi:hypothetical protein